MTDDQTRSSKVLQRIALALGNDVAIFRDERASDGTVEEAFELLAAFERVVDRADRRACLDFVSSVAARQGKSGS